MLSHALSVSAPTQVERYKVFEITITHNEISYANVWEDANVSATFTTPSGNAITIDGFYYSRNTWKVRFVPSQPGQYRWSVKLDNFSDSGVFTSINAGKNGFIRKSSTNPYRLVYDLDGRLYNMLGINNAYSLLKAVDLSYWDKEGWSLDGKDEGVGVDEYLNAMFTETGFNVFRWSIGNGSPTLWQAITSSGNIYKEKEAIFGDLLVQKLREKEVRIFMDIFGWKPPYLRPSDYNDSAKIASLKHYIKYIVARYSAYVDFWEIGNEKKSFIFTGKNDDVHDEWIKLVADYLKSIDPYKHMISISWERPDHQSIDISSPHWYNSAPPATNDSWDTAMTAMIKVSRGYSWPPGQGRFTKNNYPKPIIYGEMGNSNCSYEPGSNERARVRAWTAFFNEAYLIWWEANWTDPLHPWCPKNRPANIYIGPGLRPYFKAMQDYTTTVDANVVMTSTSSLKPPNGVTLRYYELSSTNSLYLYIKDADSKNKKLVSGAQVNVSPPKAGTAYWYDTTNGKILKTLPVTRGKQTLTIPDFTLDIAFKVVGQKPSKNQIKK